MFLKKLEISNILSIEEAIIEFPDCGLVLVDGWNHDSDGANGAGKTAIFNSLSFAIYGKMPRNITATEILRKGSKSGYATATFTVGTDEYTVKNCRPTDRSVTKNGVPINLTQQELEATVGLNYEQFLLSSYSSQSSSNKFIDLNDSAKKDFFIKLMNVDSFARCRKESEDAIRLLEVKRISIASDIRSDSAKVDTYTEFNTDRESIEQDIFKLRESVDLLNHELSQLLIPLSSKDQHTDVELSLRNKLKDIQTKKLDRTDSLIKLNNLDRHLKDVSAGSCSWCGNSIHDKGKVDELDGNRNNLLGHISILDKTISKENEIVTLLNKITTARIHQESEQSFSQERRSSVSRLIKGQKDAIAEKEHQLNKIDDVKKKIEDLRRSLFILSVDLATADEEVTILQLVASSYSSTGAMAYILDSAVDAFNHSVASYIEDIWADAVYSLHSYRENKDGSVVAKFSDSLIIDSFTRSIGSLSGGERKALSIAIDLAIVDVLVGQFGIAVSPLVLDEPFDGLDQHNREIVIRLLKKIAVDRCVLVVDHMTESGAWFDSCIRVEKKEGKSTIVSA